MVVTHLNSDNFKEESKGLMIVDFWAPWCGPCQMMGPVFEELSGEYEGKLKFAKINTDEEGPLSQQFSIQGIPCLIMMKDGEEVDRIVGFAAKDQLKEKIDAILNKA